MRIHNSQSGAILVTSLLLLLILTVLGVAMMKMTNMQERMAGNTRDLNLALQGAEAGLRDAETRLRRYTIATRPISAAYPAACVICLRDTLPIAIDDPNLFNWPVDAQEFGVAGTKDITQLSVDPRVVVEEVAFVRDNYLAGQEVPEGRDFYQISSRSTGASGLTNTVLQSTYARRW